MDRHLARLETLGRKLQLRYGSNDKLVQDIQAALTQRRSDDRQRSQWLDQHLRPFLSTGAARS